MIVVVGLGCGEGAPIVRVVLLLLLLQSRALRVAISPLGPLGKQCPLHRPCLPLRCPRWPLPFSQRAGESEGAVSTPEMRGDHFVFFNSPPARISRKQTHPGDEGRRHDGSGGSLADLVLGTHDDGAGAVDGGQGARERWCKGRGKRGVSRAESIVKMQRAPVSSRRSGTSAPVVINGATPVLRSGNADKARDGACCEKMLLLLAPRCLIVSLTGPGRRARAWWTSASRPFWKTRLYTRCCRSVGRRGLCVKGDGAGVARL